MVKYKIIQYHKSHVEDILVFGINDKLLEADAHDEENRIDIAVPGLSHLRGYIVIKLNLLQRSDKD